MNISSDYKILISKGLKQARKERKHTQEEFANLLGLSQPQYSKIESGEASLTAEQFLLLLDRFVLPLSHFVGTKGKSGDAAAPLQNALAKLGASHLREIPGVFIPEKYFHPNEVIFDVLQSYPDPRFVAALGPVIIKNISKINLPLTEKRLAEWGHENRLWYVLENALESVRDRLRNAPFLSKPVKLAYHRAATALTNYQLIGQSREDGEWYRSAKPADIFDPITTEKTLEKVKRGLDELAKRWNIITSLKQSDFEEALKNSEGP